MRKLHFLLIALAMSINACLPAALQQPEATNPPPPDLNATAAILSQQTLEALPTQTIEPSHTPQVLTATNTPIQATATETQNNILLTLTATLGTGTVSATNGQPTLAGTQSSPTVSSTRNLSATTTPSVTPNSYGLSPTETAHLQYSGTMPPNLPYGLIELTNKSKTEVYISMRCVTKDGYVTIIEYPVDSSVIAKGPAGKYTYVVWVGGRKITGDFSLGKNQEISIFIYKDRVTIN